MNMYILTLTLLAYINPEPGFIPHWQEFTHGRRVTESCSMKYIWLWDNVLAPMDAPDLRITSGYRTARVNREVGGVKESFHRCLGNNIAVDVIPVKRWYTRYLRRYSMCTGINERDHYHIQCVVP